MATRKPLAHTLLWKDREQTDVLGWTRYHLDPDRPHQRPYKVETGQLSKLARFATGNALVAGDISIGWGRNIPTSIAELETAVRELKPIIIICPERTAEDEKRLQFRQTRIMPRGRDPERA
jgi:hypothetical protein